MRYFFKSTIDEEGDHFSIRIPFNIWEVCKHREVIDGEIMLDNKYIACKLLPTEKGNYVINLTREDVSHMDLSKKHDLLLHVSGSLIKMNQNSPYSVENPIRKIDHIDIIIQPMDGVCGQTVVAMLAGVTIADVSKTMGIREWQATMGVVISALNYYGIDHNDIIVYTEGEPVTLPKCAVLMEKMGRFSHYLLYFDGKYYDPNDGVFTDYDQSKLLGYLEIYTE